MTTERTNVFFSRDEPERAVDATLPDVTSDEAMIETNEIPESEGVVRAEGKICMTESEDVIGLSIMNCGWRA